MSDPDALGRYYTPRAVARQCVDMVLPALGVRRPRTILEPSAGSGSFLMPLRQAFPLAKITAIDVAPDPTTTLEAIRKVDFLDADFNNRFDLIVGNPPYREATPFCIKALASAPTVVFLMRLGFLAARKRYDFWRSYPPAWVFVLPLRPSFRGGNTDVKTDYGWVCWQAGVAVTQLAWLPPYR